MMPRRSIVFGGLAVALLTVGCSDDGDDTSGSSVRTVIELADSQPGDVIALRAAGGEPGVVEWADRRAGTIRSIDLGDGDPSIDDIVTLASIEVGTDGEQRGLLGHTVIDGVRYAAWTDPDTEHLLVGALGDVGADGDPATVDRIVWDAGGTAGGAVGGFLDGQLRRWSADPPAYDDDSLGPCLTGAAVLPDGTIVTATADGLVSITP